jgi:hypothetical protein
MSIDFNSINLDYCLDIKNAANSFNQYDSRPSSEELCAINNFYGISAVIRRYIYGSDRKHRTLYGSWPHGIHYNSLYRRYELQLPYAAVYCLDTHESAQQLRFTQFKKPKLVPTAPPIKYASLMLDNVGLRFNPKEDSLLFFPAHSSLLLNLNSYCLEEQIKRLRVKHRQINMCVFWVDVLNKTFESSYHLFDHIYCAGHQFDDNFLLRLSCLIRSHKYFSGTSLGSYFWNSLLLGCIPDYEDEDIKTFAAGYTVSSSNNTESCRMFESFLNDQKDVNRQESLWADALGLFNVNPLLAMPTLLKQTSYAARILSPAALLQIEDKARFHYQVNPLHLPRRIKCNLRKSVKPLLLKYFPLSIR